jgi:uncharacterized membrane protein YqjE
MDRNNNSPGLRTLVQRLVGTGWGALRNRGELLAVEWQEEKARLTQLLIWTVGLLFLGMMAMVLLTGTIILLFREEHRLYVAGAFTLLYLIGAIVAWFVLKSLLKQEPFSESIGQAKKDAAWLESIK